MDITEHRTDQGKVYLAAVVDAWSRRVVDRSMADHIRAELVADALQMATWRRRPPKGQTIAHSDHGAQGELLDQRHWHTRDQLALAVFDWIETWYNPKRRHSYCNGLSPLDYETATAK